MTDLNAEVERALSAAVGTPVRIARSTPLAGGSINRTARIDTTAGTFVVKSNRDEAPDLFTTEADGLAAIRASATSLVVPKAIACAAGPPAFLVLEDLGDGSPAPDHDERLGRGLAELHRSRSARAGFAHDNYCGATPQPNPWTNGWIDFYRDARLGYQVQLAARGGLLSTNEIARFDRLLVNLANWLHDPPDGFALIHGDLWSGNLHTTRDGAPALIDPAASFSHREAEFGMMTLFGGFSRRVYDAYDDAFPFEPGWRDRNPLYQLYHLLNHLNLFGRGYHARVMAIVQRYT